MGGNNTLGRPTGGQQGGRKPFVITANTKDEINSNKARSDGGTHLQLLRPGQERGPHQNRNLGMGGVIEYSTTAYPRSPVSTTSKSKNGS